MFVSLFWLHRTCFLSSLLLEYEKITIRKGDNNVTSSLLSPPVHDAVWFIIHAYYHVGCTLSKIHVTFAAHVEIGYIYIYKLLLLRMWELYNLMKSKVHGRKKVPSLSYRSYCIYQLNICKKYWCFYLNFVVLLYKPLVSW